MRCQARPQCAGGRGTEAAAHNGPPAKAPDKVSSRPSSERLVLSVILLPSLLLLTNFLMKRRMAPTTPNQVAIQGFVHLHVHSEYSLSSSLVRVDELIKKVDAYGMGAVALTDWGNLYGALHFLKATKGEAEGRVKPIYGLEVGVTIDGTGPWGRHFVLLAESFEGFQNLCRIATAAHVQYGLEGEVLRPKIPLEEVFKHKAGLIALTGGLKGVLNSFLVQDQEGHAIKTLDLLVENFGKDHLFLELQDSSLSTQAKCNEKLIEWGRERGIGVVATCDVHYMNQDDAFAQEVWMMVSQKMTLEENPNSRLTPKEFYLREPKEMEEIFAHVPEAISNTTRIAERCTGVKLSFKDKEGKRIFHLPDFSVEGSTQEELFDKECRAGLKNRLDEIAKAQGKEISAELLEVYEKRLVYEVETIQKMGFPGYYLIVSDFIRWAKSHGIPVGPGRGSGAGSLAAYALDITDLDPIEHGLLFERFLNPERVSLPDFDVDFCQERREEVIRYVEQKYGKDRVCQIVTFAKEQSKNALKDVGRVLGMSFGETNRLTKLIPAVMAKPLTIQETIDEVPEFAALAKDDPKIRECVNLALRIEGALRQPGVHAAGVIIASKPVAEIAPLSVELGGGLITQWDMKMSEEAGLVKFDFLGLVTLDLMDIACKLVNKRPQPETQALRYSNIPLHDPRAYKIISDGDTMGVFQLESSGMQNLCTRMKPDRFADIAAINALFRPGPLQSGMVDDFINRKHGRAKVEVIFPEMESSLRETYGVIIYQEQVMEIARVVAGYSLGGADLLRRAMGKKNAKEMDQQRSAFVDGAVKAGKPAAKAGELFDLIEKFAGYGFNKSHAAAYAALSVQTAFLKAVYPTEFFTALLTIEKEDTDKLSRYIADARQRGLKILPPDINESAMDFSIVSESVIRFGLSAIKNVGESGVEAVLEARMVEGKGPFKDLFDFVSRVDTRRVNKRMCEALIQAGAFDSFEEDKAQLRGRYLANIEKALEWASKEAANREGGQFSLFGESPAGGPAGGGQDFNRPVLDTTFTPPTQRQLLDWEKLLLGIYVSGSPLDRYLERAKTSGCVPIFSLGEGNPQSNVTIAALVSEIREVRVKKGRRAGELMGILKLEDHSGQIEMVSFPDHFKEYAGLLKSGRPLVIRAELDFEEDKPKLMCGEVSINGRLAVEDLTEVEEKYPRKIKLDIALNRIEGAISHEHLYTEIVRILKKYPGKVPVEVQLFKSGMFSTKMEVGSRFTVHPARELLSELSGMVAIPGSLRVEAVH